MPNHFLLQKVRKKRAKLTNCKSKWEENRNKKKTDNKIHNAFFFSRTGRKRKKKMKTLDFINIRG